MAIQILNTTISSWVVTFNTLTTKFLNRYRLEVNAFAMATDSDHLDFESGLAPVVGGSAVLPADVFDVELAFMHVDDDFSPALGFAPRTGVRRYYSNLTYKPYIESKAWLRQAYFSYEGEYITDLSNNLSSAKHLIAPLQLWFESGDQLLLEVENSSDVPDSQFHNSIIQMAMKMTFTSPPGTTPGRVGLLVFKPLPSVIFNLVSITHLAIFSMVPRIENRSELTFLPSKHFGTVLSYSKQDVELPTGDFNIKLASLTALINFTPDFSWSNLFQYDNISDSMGFNSRLIWEYRPGVPAFSWF